MTPQNRNKYLLKKYGITLDEYNRMLNKNDGGCWICGRKGVTRSLAVDHDHKYKRTDTTSHKSESVWRVLARYHNQTFLCENEKRNVAVRNLRERLKRESVRGLLCPHCNSGLIKYGDDPVRLANAAKYLENFYFGNVIIPAPESSK